MLQPSVLRRRAGDLLQRAAYDPKKLVLLHTAVAAGSLFLVNIINYLLSLQIAQTGGLGGIGLRSVLTTVQSVLELVITIALPFWEMGLVFAALQWAKGESSVPADLLGGFRRFGAILRLRLLQGILLFVIVFGVFNISYIIFLVTPFADPLLAQLEPIIQQAGTSVQPEMLITEELLMSTAQHCIPLFVIFGALFAVVLIPVFYRVRFADFAVMEEGGALKALLKSVKLTKKHSLQIFKLDLSFWWFYLLQAACIAIGYGDSLLSALGVALPLSSEMRFFLFSGLSLLLQGALLWQYQGSVLTSYALAYQTLGQPTPTPQVVDLPQDI